MTNTATVPTVIDGLAQQTAMCVRVVHRNLEGVTHDESLLRPSPAGNSANWVVGHILATRSNVLKRLGESPLMDEATTEQYRRGSSGDLKTPWPLERLLATLQASQPILVERLRRFTSEELNEKCPFPTPAGPDATMAEALASLVFHESYHAGQLGLLRRLCGKTGAI